MKALFRVIGLLSLLAVVACHSPRREARRMVDQAERLLDSYPDSTVLLVDSVLRMEVFLPERYRMEMALLQGEALLRDVALDEDDLEKELTPVAPSLELEHAAAYFAQKKEYSKASHAALYSGYVQQYYNEKEAAMQSYKDAEQYGSLAGEDYIVAKARCRMGRMLYKERMCDEALKQFKSAESGFVERFEEYALVDNMIAVTCITLQQYDSAAHYLNQSRLYAELSNSEKAKMKTRNNSAVLYRIQGKYRQSIDCLRLGETVTDSTLLFLSYLNIGKTFSASGELDSAYHYYRSVEKLLPVVLLREETKVSACLALSIFFEREGDFDKALQYRKQSEKILDEIRDNTEERSVYGIQRMYDYENVQKMMNQQMLHRHRIIIAAIFFAALCFAALALSQIRLAKIRKEEVDAKNKLFHFMQQNKVLLEKNEIKEKELKDYALLFSEALEKEALVMRKLDIYMSNRGEVAFLNALEEAVFSHKDHWEALMMVFDSLYPGVRENLAMQCDLTEMEQKIFILSYFNVSREDEALMFGKSVHLVDKWRNGISKKMGKVRNF